MSEQDHDDPSHDHDQGHDDPSHDHDHDDHTHDHDHDDHSHDHDHDAAPERGEQTVTIEDVGPARKCLTIELPQERIANAISDSYGKLKEDAVIPGFRRGRAPKRLIEKRFGSGVRDDVRGQLISEAYSQAVEDENLEVLGEPDIKDIDDIKLPEEGPMIFKVEIEVIPQFDLPSLEGIEINKPTVTIGDNDLDEEIEELRQRFGSLEAIPDAVVKTKDFIIAQVDILAGKVADSEEKQAEAEVLESKDEVMVFVPGKETEFKGQVAGIIIEGLGKKLKGKKVGDLISVAQNGPSTHENEKIKDQPITLNIRIKRVERLEPASIESLLPQFGVETEKEMRDTLKGVLEQRIEQKQKTAMHEQAAEYLMSKIEMQLPEGLSGRQTGRILQRRAMEMAYQGVPEQQIQDQLADLRARSEEDAARELKLQFILDRAAKALEIEVNDGEINSRISMMAVQQGRRPEKLRQEMRSQGQLEQLYVQIRDQKTLDKILANAKIKEVELTDEENGPKSKKKTKKTSTPKTKKASPKKTDEESQDKSEKPAATKKKTSKSKKDSKSKKSKS